MSHEPWPNGLFPIDRASASQRVSKVRSSLSWRSLLEELLLLGSVSRHGFRTIDLQGESPPYRSLPRLYAEQAVSTCASAVRCPTRVSPMPTNCATGESMPTLLRFLSVSRAPCMPTIPWAWSWIKTCMPWIPRPSISACRCFPGPDFADTKPRSRCIPCWICMAASPRLSALQKGKRTTSPVLQNFTEFRFLALCGDSQ
jgi:hypothetical protein